VATVWVWFLGVGAQAADSPTMERLKKEIEHNRLVVQKLKADLLTATKQIEQIRQETSKQIQALRAEIALLRDLCGKQGIKTPLPKKLSTPGQFNSVLRFTLFKYDPQSKSFKKFAVTPWPEPIKIPITSWYAVPARETTLDAAIEEVSQKKFPVYLQIERDENIGAIHGISDYVAGLECRSLTDLSFRVIGTMTNLEVLKCRASPVTDEGVKQLTPLRKLRILHVTGDVSDKSLSVIARLNTLEDLEIGGTITTIAPLVGLRKLHRLSLQGAKITSRGMATVGRFENLRKFNLGNYNGQVLSQVEVEDIMGHLAQSRTLEELTLLRTRMGDDGIAKLLPLQSLKVLDMWFGGKTSFTSDGFKLFAQFKKLEKLTVSDPRKQISSDAKQWLKEQLPKCEIHVTDGGR